MKKARCCTQLPNVQLRSGPRQHFNEPQPYFLALGER